MDHFKTVNDTHGHNCGDQVLISLAALMRSRLPRARLCRWGGEEFLIAGRREEGDPLPVLEKLREEVEKAEFSYHEISLKMTVTIGFSWYEPGQSIDEWIDAADRNLYRGKQSGRNQLVAG